MWEVFDGAKRWFVATEGVSEREEEDGYLDKRPEERHDCEVSGEGKFELPRIRISFGHREENGVHVFYDWLIGIILIALF